LHSMQSVYSILLATALVPMGKAWWANRGTALEHAVLWAVAAWAAWLATFVFGDDGSLGRYAALSLTGCAGIAVLGARRPHIAAWDFVVVSLLAVLLLPVAQGWGKPALSPPYLVFLGATLAFGWLNYLPTRLLPAVLLFGAGGGMELAQLCGVKMDDTLLGVARFAIALTPWVGQACFAWPRGELNAVDREWLSFRDRFGVVWGQRCREQFNRAAANAGWPVTLSWQGFDLEPDRPTPPVEELLATLRAVLKRFGTKEANV
jgi:hypothetical protein